VDLCTLADSPGGVLAAGATRPGALSVRLAAHAALQAHRDHRRRRLYVPARDPHAPRADLEGSERGEGNLTEISDL